MLFLNYCFLSFFFKSRLDTSLMLNTNFSSSLDYESNSGIDMRYPNSTDFDEQLNKKILTNFLKMNLLKNLEDKKISDFDKIKLIDKSYIFDYNYTFNIFAGGLLDDFNF
jgi:HKD family nuclease